MSESLLSKIQNFGFDVDTLNLDGRVHRFKTSNKPKKKNGWYVGKTITLRGGRTLDIATVGDWALGETKTFTSNDEMNDSDRKMFSAAAKKMQDEMDKLQEIERAKAAKEAALLWADGIAVEKGFEYLQKKGIETLKAVDAIRMTKDKSAIVIPVFNKNGDVRSCQVVGRNGEKRFLTGGEIRGNFFPIAGSGDKCIVCEGFATGATIYSALSGQVSVIVAFNASNLFTVCTQMVLEYGADRVFVAADDDRYNGHNAGLFYSDKCKELGVKVIVPNFEGVGYDSRPTDFNDLHSLGGLDHVTDQIKNVVFGIEIKIDDNAPALVSPPKVETGPELWPSKDIGFYVMVPQKNGQLKKDPRYHELSKYLHYDLKVRISDNEELVWDKTHYKQIGRNELLSLVHKLTNDQTNPEHFEKFVKVIRAECDEGNFNFLPTTGLINLANGILDVKTRKVSQHDSAYDFRYVLPYSYDNSAKCPLWERFLSEVFEGDRELISVVQEIFGYVLIGGEPFLHKAFMLYGTGRNGKSVFLKVLQAIIGEANYSNTPIENLDEKHVKAGMIGRLANISPETSKKGIESAIFKSIVGGDEISDRHLYHGFFSFRLTCRMFFSGNFFPRFGDNSVGLNERLFILPFKRFFKPEEQDRGLFLKLNGELAGVFNWALDGAERLISRGCLPKVKAVDDMADEYRKESDSVYAFYKERCEVGLFTEAALLGSFYDSYKDFCADNEVKARREKKGFCMVLKSLLLQEFGHGAVDRDRDNFSITKYLKIKGENQLSGTSELTRGDAGTKRSVIRNYAPQGEQKKHWFQN